MDHPHAAHARPKVYVAGPYTKGDVAGNVRNALQAANMLASFGYTPFVPHLTHFWHLLYPRTYEFWLAYDLQFLPGCAALLRLPGESNGADLEVREAGLLGIPCYTVIRELHADLSGLGAMVLGESKP